MRPEKNPSKCNLKNIRNIKAQRPKVRGCTPSVGDGRHGDHAAGDGALQHWQQQIGQQEVTQMIDSQLSLKTVFCQPSWTHHHSCRQTGGETGRWREMGEQTGEQIDRWRETVEQTDRWRDRQIETDG